MHWNAQGRSYQYEQIEWYDKKKMSNRIQKREQKKSRRNSLRKEDKARRSQSRKQDPKREKARISVVKKFETKTKGRRLTGDEKERRFQFEMNSKSGRKQAYTRPVVHVERKKS